MMYTPRFWMVACALAGAAIACAATPEDRTRLADGPGGASESARAGGSSKSAGAAGGASGGGSSAPGAAMTDAGDEGHATDAPHDGGAPPPPDAGSSIDVFTDAGPYAGDPPSTQAQSEHRFPLAGLNCALCHVEGGEGPAFLFGGRVFADVAGTTPAANVEVRVVDADGKAHVAYSDLGGYFWSRESSTSFPARTGARTALAARPMIAALANAANGGCVSCHNGTTAPPVHVP